MNYNFKQPPPPPQRSYCFFYKILVKSCLSFEDLAAYVIVWFHADWCKFCVHLRSLNFHCFRMFGIQN
jgi:thiol-disulfide isomerase/thioredoxin